MRRSTKKGFTLAELLIVIAIIAILIAIMFPVFGAQIDKARAAAELANVRAAYSEEVADSMLGDGNDITAPVSSATVNLATLAKAMQYTDTTVTYNPTDLTITVTYNGYSGSFKIDEDVVVSSDDTAASKLEAVTTYYNNGTSSKAA